MQSEYKLHEALINRRNWSLSRGALSRYRSVRYDGFVFLSVLSCFFSRQRDFSDNIEKRDRQLLVSYEVAEGRI